MNRTLPFYSIAIFLVLAPSLKAQDSLTVDDAVRQVLEKHPTVQGALQAVQASMARVEQSRSTGLPGSDADISYTRLAPISEAAFGPEVFQLYPANNYDAHVRLRQTLYDFGRTDAAVEAGKSAVQSANDNIEVIKAGLAFQTIQTFYSILFLRQSVDIQQQQIDALNGHLDLARKRVESGSATDYDILTTQVRVAAAQNQKIDLQSDAAKQEAVLRRLLGLPADAALPLKGALAGQPVGVNMDSLTAIALKQRAELKLSHDAERSAELQKNVIALRDKPSLNISLQFGVKNGFFPDLDVFRGNLAATVGVTAPIFNGYRTKNEEEEAQANMLSAQSRTTDTERMIASEVQQAVADVRSSADKLQSAQLQIDQAKQALEMARVRYQSGVITTLDLIDAENSLAQAELSRLTTLYRFVVSRYALERAVGKTF